MSGRSGVRSWRRIFTIAALRTCTMQVACASIHAAIIGLASTFRPKPGRR